MTKTLFFHSMPKLNLRPWKTSVFGKFKKSFAPFWQPWCRWLLCMYAWDIWIPAKMCLALDMESLYNVYVRGSLHTKASLFLPTLAAQASLVDSALPPVVYFVWTDWLWHKRPVNNLVRRRSKLASKIACFSNTVVCISYSSLVNFSLQSFKFKL